MTAAMSAGVGTLRVGHEWSYSRLVDVFPDFDDVDSLQRDLEGAGLQAVVIHFRAAPSLEGVVEVSSHNNEASGAIEFQGGQFAIDTAAVDGEIEILIYSPTKPGDDFQVSPSVFAPGQVFEGLHCAYPKCPAHRRRLRSPRHQHERRNSLPHSPQLLPGAGSTLVIINTPSRHSVEISNTMGRVHGGFLAALIDITTGQCVKRILDDGHSLVTATTNTEYLGPARAGDRLRAEVTVEHCASTLVFASCRISTEDRLITIASVVFSAQSSVAP